MDKKARHINCTHLQYRLVKHRDLLIYILNKSCMSDYKERPCHKRFTKKCIRAETGQCETKFYIRLLLQIKIYILHT